MNNMASLGAHIAVHLIASNIQARNTPFEFEAAHTELTTRLANIVRGELPENGLESVPRLAIAYEGTRIPGYIVDLLRHEGMDPVIAIAFAFALGTMRIEIGGRSFDTGGGDPDNFHIEVEIATRVHATSNNMIMMDPLPETMIAGLPGTRLADVLSHPALDAHNLVVESASNGADQNGMEDHGLIRLLQMPLVEIHTLETGWCEG